MFARSSIGFASEHQAYAAGWRIPDEIGGRAWIVAECACLALPNAEEVWAALPNVRFRIIPDAGLLVYFTRPEMIAELVAEV